MIPGTPGIYRINGPNGRFYVGSAVSLSRRWIAHKNWLKRGRHGNINLQRAWDKYGSESFTFEVLEHVNDVNNLLECEQRCLDVTNAVRDGYNILPMAGNNLGFKMSAESKRKMSEAMLGKKHGPMSEEQKRLLSAALKGRPQPEQARIKSAESRKGRKHSPEHCANISAALAGKSLSEEHKAKLATAKLGSTIPSHVRAKMSASHKRRLQQAQAFASP